MVEQVINLDSHKNAKIFCYETKSIQTLYAGICMIFWSRPAFKLRKRQKSRKHVQIEPYRSNNQAFVSEPGQNWVWGLNGFGSPFLTIIRKRKKPQVLYTYSYHNLFSRLNMLHVNFRRIVKSAFLGFSRLVTRGSPIFHFLSLFVGSLHSNNVLIIILRYCTLTLKQN